MYGRRVKKEGARNMNNLTFITNEGEQKLTSRFATLIKDTKNFDCLVGYFYASGFNGLYKSLEKILMCYPTIYFTKSSRIEV